MVSDATLDAFNFLHEYELASRKLLDGPHSDAFIFAVGVTGDMWRVTMPSADLSSVIPGHAVYITLGDNEGYHEITAVSVVGNSVDFTDPDGAAQGSAEASIYSLPLSKMERIITGEVIPWAETTTRTSFTGVTEFVEYHDGSGTPELMLDRRNIVSLLSVETLNVPQDILLIRAEDVEVIGDRGLLRVKSTTLESVSAVVASFPRGVNNIKVRYSAGFVDFPYDVAQAISLMAGNLFLGEEGGFDGGGGSLSVEGYSRSHGADGPFTEIRRQMSVRARSILSKYRTGVVGN